MSILVSARNEELCSHYTAWIAANPLRPERKKPYALFRRLEDDNRHALVPFAEGLKHVFNGGREMVLTGVGALRASDEALRFQGGSDDSDPRAEEQERLVEEAFDFLRGDGAGHCILAAPPGFGKTRMAIRLLAAVSGQSGRASVIVYRQTPLRDQWLRSLRELLPEAKVVEFQRKHPEASLESGADILLISMGQLMRWTRPPLCVNLLVADEVHTLTSAAQSLALLNIRPSRLLGLSATPYRNDDFQTALEWIFGKNILEPKRPVSMRHFVYKIETGIRMGHLTRERDGRWQADYGAILDAQASNEKRTSDIVALMNQDDFKNVRWLVLVKRLKHVESFFRACVQADMTVSMIAERKKATFDRDARVLVGTIQKVGTGFDEPGRNGLVVAADSLAYYIQLLGRVFRQPHPKQIPVVFDVVDDAPVLERHYLQRERVYKQHNGSIDRSQL